MATQWKSLAQLALSQDGPLPDYIPQGVFGALPPIETKVAPSFSPKDFSKAMLALLPAKLEKLGIPLTEGNIANLRLEQVPKIDSNGCHSRLMLWEQEILSREDMEGLRKHLEHEFNISKGNFEWGKKQETPIIDNLLGKFPEIDPRTEQVNPHLRPAPILHEEVTTVTVTIKKQKRKLG